jgi:hypothetical protein
VNSFLVDCSPYQTNVNFPQNYGTLPLYFGTSGQSYWDHKLRGALDEVSLYNRALSSNEPFCPKASFNCPSTANLSNFIASSPRVI